MGCDGKKNLIVRAALAAIIPVAAAALLGGTAKAGGLTCGDAEVVAGDDVWLSAPEFAGADENGESFEKYVEQVFADEAAENDGVYMRAVLPERYSSNEDRLRRLWANDIKAVADGTRSSTVMIYRLSDIMDKTMFTAKELGIKEITGLNAEVVSALEKKYPDLSAVYCRILSDCPYELYWHNKVDGVKTAFGGGYILGTDSEGRAVAGFSDTAWVRLSMTVSAAYSATGGNSFLADPDKTGAPKAAAAKAASVAGNASGFSDTGMLEYYRDWIRSQVRYDGECPPADAENYGDPWQLIYVFDDDPETNVVCEGYAKAFKYLCDLSSFTCPDTECRIMTGTMDGNRHMWNVLHMEDGRNYLADITLFSEEHPNELFLSGRTEERDGGYGFRSGDGILWYHYDSDCALCFSDEEMAIADTDYKRPQEYVESSDTLEALVERMYADFLFRAPDAAGFDYWCSSVRNAADTNAAALRLVTGFVRSPEFRNANRTDEEIVSIMYRAVLGRDPDSAGFDYWMQVIRDDGSIDRLIRGFACSEEFTEMLCSYGLSY